MEVNKETILPNGKRRVTVTLDSDEHLIPICNSGHYKLGSQLDDVVAGHYITEAVPVSWCSIEQKWVE